MSLEKEPPIPCSYKVRSKTHKRLKERFLIRRNRKKNVQIFEVILFFKLRTIQQKTVKPTYLLPVRCQEAGGRKRARDPVSDFST